MSAGVRRLEQQTVFIRQATILRKNLSEWDRMLRDPRGEDWPTMLGRLNASLNQSVTMDKSIADVMEHFVYLPKKSTADAQAIPFFLSTRLETPAATSTTNDNKDGKTVDEGQPKKKRQRCVREDPIEALANFENRAAELAADYEENMVRF